MGEIAYRWAPPELDPGTKYVQYRDWRSPRNVHALGDRPGRGVRMEDYAVVDYLGERNRRAVLAIVADGHGSIAAFSPTGMSEDATRFLGGYESAQLAAESAYRFVRAVSDQVDLRQLTRQGVAKLLHDAFAYAQRRVEDETTRGARPVPRGGGPAPGWNTIAAERERLAQLTASEIDGHHFRDLHTLGGLGPGSDDAAGDPRVLVADKFLQPYDAAPRRSPDSARLMTHVTQYVSGDGARRTVAEFGTTVTAAMLLPMSDPTDPHSAGMAYVANVGDSDAYLFYRPTPTAPYVPIRLTGDHTVRNDAEARRLAPYGVARRGVYFTLRTGPFRGHSLMPSRSLGHSVLSKHGFTAQPTVSTASMHDGDVLVVASDGLWAAAGTDDETRVVARVAHEVTRQAARSPDGRPDSAALTRAIADDLRHRFSIRDNLAIVAIVAQAPHAAERRPPGPLVSSPVTAMAASPLL